MHDRADRGGHRTGGADPIIMHLARKQTLVIDEDEFRTSRLCCACHHELKRADRTLQPAYGASAVLGTCGRESPRFSGTFAQPRNPPPL